MSKAKFAAAKELIEEQRYDEARAILLTINHPAAADWLRKLDKMMPPVPPPIPTPVLHPAPSLPYQPARYISDEQEKYYRAENRWRRIGLISPALAFIVAGIGCVGTVTFIFILNPSVTSFVDPGYSVSLFSPIEAIAMGIGVFFVLFIISNILIWFVTMFVMLLKRD